MQKPLKISALRQQRGKPHCGPVCMKMVLGFYGHKMTVRELVRSLPMIKTGIDMCAMGLFLIQMGFKVTVYLDTTTADAKNPAYKHSTPRFTGWGGCLIPRPIKISEIRTFLARSIPVILNVDNDDHTGHFIVARGIGKKRMTVNDPVYGSCTPSIQTIMSASRSWTGGAVIVERVQKPQAVLL